MFAFRCNSCGKVHEGIPSFGWDYPIQYLNVPEGERAERVTLGTDDCVIDDEWFYIKGCLEIPVHGSDEPFVWGIWVSLSEQNFAEWEKYFGIVKRSHIGPFFGWFSSDIWIYPETPINLKTTVHIRDDGIRPVIELQDADHPLVAEQRAGISFDRVSQIYEMMVHPDKFM